VYIPSSIGTILKFRSGLLGSLHDKEFNLYRFALDETTMLFGAAIWGALSTAIVMWSLAGLVALAAVYEVL
jgi:hypothetical protein